MRRDRGRAGMLAAGLLAALGALVSTGCDPAPSQQPPTQRPAPARPPGLARVAAGADLQALLDAAPAGAGFALDPGTYLGPLVLRKPVTIWGTERAVIRSSGRGSTIAVESDQVRLLGFSVDGSGGRFDLLDAAVRVHGSDVVVEGLHLERPLFGVLVEKASRVTVRGNRVRGTGQAMLGLRGDAIRFWEVRDSSIEQNHVTDSRDLVVWYSSNNRIVGNRIERGRYGTHFMYSHNNEVSGNRYTDNVVGIFLMYSRDVRLARNLIARSRGAAGIGLGVKESGNLTVIENHFLANTVGIYLDTSPLYEEHTNRIERNVISQCDTGIVFHSTPHRNTLVDNSLRFNLAQVRVDGRGNAREVTWRGNHFDDYAGYDLDGDGIGDVPYELRSFSNELVSQHPDLAFFRGTPALRSVDFAGHVLPLFAPKVLLSDPRPRLAPPAVPAPGVWPFADRSSAGITSTKERPRAR